MAAAPGISIVIPTLNCARNLTVALRSIRAQHYPADRVEIIVADGGSTDATRETAESCGCTLVDNPLVTGEAGKAAGLAHATHEIVGFVDSDNELTSPRFLEAVADALADPRIAGAEPIEFAALDTMPALDRYFALLGMNDPLVLFLGTYDRLCQVTGKWTGVDHVVVEECPTYRKIQFRRGKMPTVGANGFFTRRSIAAAAVRDGYLFDVDILHAGTSGPFIHVAKLHLGIAHHYAQSLRQFARKQRRRAQDFLYFKAAGVPGRRTAAVGCLGIRRRHGDHHSPAGAGGGRLGAPSRPRLAAPRAGVLDHAHHLRPRDAAARTGVGETAQSRRMGAIARR